MKTFCRHLPHKVINTIKAPKWSTDQILISVDKVPEHVNDYLIEFSDESPKKKYGWFYLDGKVIRRSSKQKNGNGMVYCVDMSRREEFTPINKCEHEV